MGGADTYALVVQARSGDGAARGLLLESLRLRLVLWCAARMSPQLRAEHDPEDLAQDVLVAVHRDLGTYRGEGQASFYAWVFSIAEHRIRDAAKRLAADKRRAEPRRPRTQHSPSSIARHSEAALRLREAITRLPEDHREVVRLRRFEEREFADVAEALGRSENAVRILYHRALKELREELPADL